MDAKKSFLLMPYAASNPGWVSMPGLNLRFSCCIDFSVVI